MTPHRRIAAALALAAVMAPAPAATAAQPAPEPPHLTDGHGLTVVEQPAWLDGGHRSFSFAVRSTQVPTPTLMTGQKPGQHTVVVTLPEDYDPSGTTRHPVLYSLHGNQDRPDSPWNRQLAERATAGTPLITVQPNGGRSWYSNWVNPGSLGPQNWESFHLDQVIPFVDANLRTIAAREGRAIAGHSMGGFGAFHYAEHRPELFGHLGSFSGGLDLLDQAQRVAVVETALNPASGVPTIGADTVFGPPVWPLDGVWNAQSPAQHVASLRGVGVAMYVGSGGDLLDNPVQAVVENRARQTNLVAAANLRAAGIAHDFVDYGDGSGWAQGCTGKHAQFACLQADWDHFVGLLVARSRQW
ncbi:esterase [Actinosynnema pretiosum subsp. pretiosum]|uniref:Esterase n=1 Tax=Actinosynnema pretiosum subsp. pretiosum TaxID=103721 RepID=A0AA45L824_9PSEU|nr:putative esterase [Actinosynnema pretiosum subsp. pretiosum]QUF05047.1 esterase [Actinosynnema pretiosum subsp. pretiosum]